MAATMENAKAGKSHLLTLAEWAAGEGECFSYYIGEYLKSDEARKDPEAAQETAKRLTETYRSKGLPYAKYKWLKSALDSARDFDSERTAFSLENAEDYSAEIGIPLAQSVKKKVAEVFFTEGFSFEKTKKLYLASASENPDVINESLRNYSDTSNSTKFENYMLHVAMNRGLARMNPDYVRSSSLSN